MNHYEPEIKLALNEPGAPTHYFQEYLTVCSHGVQICAKGLHQYVRFPKDTQEITITFFKRYVAESFEIGRRVKSVPYYVDHSLMFREIASYCMLDHPNVQLLQSFRSELYRYYINGFKFFRIEY